MNHLWLEDVVDSLSLSSLFEILGVAPKELSLFPSLKTLAAIAMSNLSLSESFESAYSFFFLIFGLVVFIPSDIVTLSDTC